MKRVIGVAVATLVVGAVTAALPPAAGASTEGTARTDEPTSSRLSPAEAQQRSGQLASLSRKERGFLNKRFSRETSRPGDQDHSPRAMKHVRELQYRLRWAGVFKHQVTGYYGPVTKKAVKRFQKRNDLRRSGVANRATWRALIPKTIRGRHAIPKVCKSKGWHACYDRRRHQVTLWHGGKLWNSWLVRGGARGYETRTGDFKVFRRSKDHVSGIYGTPMPNSQFFSGGQAFHGSPFLIDPFDGHSHGCVNMYLQDARQLWSLTADKNLRVHVRGRWS